jgi:septum formation protein
MYTRWINFVNQKKIVLASGSQQRIKILKDLGLEFESKTSDFPEDLEKTNAREYVEKTSFKKFFEFFKNNLSLDIDILITADTICENSDGTILEKPKDENDIYDWFRKYSNNKIVCYTSVVIGMIDKNTKQILKYNQFTNKTDVYFDEITDEMIYDYIKSGEPFNRAGGFAIQGIGRCLIKKIDGCYYNVVGFPIQEFTKSFVKLLKEVYGDI